MDYKLERGVAQAKTFDLPSSSLLARSPQFLPALATLIRQRPQPDAVPGAVRLHAACAWRRTANGKMTRPRVYFKNDPECKS